jgi:hypothetical protein
MTTPAAKTVWTRGDRRCGVALAALMIVAWLVAWGLPLSERAVRAVTWLPLMQPDLGRYGSIAFALFVVVQVVRHWRAPATAGEVRSFSLPIVRAMFAVIALTFIAAAVDSAAQRLALERAHRVAVETTARLDEGAEPSKLTLLESFEREAHRVHRTLVGAQGARGWSRRQEAVWIEHLPVEKDWESRSTRGPGWKRDFEALGEPSSAGRWYLMTTTWHDGRDAETGDLPKRSGR